MQSAPSEMEAFCHVPAQVSTALGPSRKQAGGQDGHSFVPPGENILDGTPSRNVVDGE